MTTENAFVLRRSTTPYLALGAILVGIALWISADAFRKRDMGTIESAMILVGIYALYVLIGTRYRISVHDNTITQRAFAKPTVSIPINEITSVGTERSDLKTMVQMNRPFRRIVINAADGTHASTIDVSIKHFLARDIRKLMSLIHALRPDLQLHTLWIESEGAAHLQ